MEGNIESNERVLLGTSFPLLEVDPEESWDIEETALIQYEFLEIINYIGEPEFKQVYLEVRDDVMTQSLQNRAILCSHILQKITEIYGYEFPIMVDLTDEKNVAGVFELIEFLEYNHIDFFAKVWKRLKVNLLSLDIKEFCETNRNKIIASVDREIQTEDFGQLISIFLRTNDKFKMVGLFTRLTEKSKILIILRMMEGER